MMVLFNVDVNVPNVKRVSKYPFTIIGNAINYYNTFSFRRLPTIISNLNLTLNISEKRSGWKCGGNDRPVTNLLQRYVFLSFRNSVLWVVLLPGLLGGEQVWGGRMIVHLFGLGLGHGLDCGLGGLACRGVALS